MSPHLLFFKRVIWFQMIAVVGLVVLGALYALGLWVNDSLLLRFLDPVISILSTVVFYGLFLVPIVWILGRFIFVSAFSKRIPIELKERLQRLAVETLHRMDIHPGSTRFTVRKRSSSASARRSFFRDTIAVGEQLLKDASDAEIEGILGHELGHILKGRLRSSAVSFRCRTRRNRVSGSHSRGNSAKLESRVCGGQVLRGEVGTKPDSLSTGETEGVLSRLRIVYASPAIKEDQKNSIVVDNSVDNPHLHLKVRI